MRALRLMDWKSDPVLVDVPEPSPGPGQVVVRIIVGPGGGTWPVSFFSQAYELSVQTTYWGSRPELVEVLDLGARGLLHTTRRPSRCRKPRGPTRSWRPASWSAAPSPSPRRADRVPHRPGTSLTGYPADRVLGGTGGPG